MRGHSDCPEGPCVSCLLCVSSLLVLGRKEAPMCQSQGPQVPQPLLVLRSYRTGGSQQLGVHWEPDSSQHPCHPSGAAGGTSPLLRVSWVFQDCRPGGSQHSTEPRGTSSTWMDSVPSSGNVPRGWSLYPEMCCPHWATARSSKDV